MPRRGAAIALARLLVAVLGLAPPAGAVELSGGTTTLTFSSNVLANLGIAVVEAEPSAGALREGGLGFRVEPGSRADFDAADFEGFADIALRHAGGFALRVGGETLRLAGLRVGAAADPDELALSDASGRVWLLAGAMHARVSPSGLEIANADLVLAPELAALLGRPELARRYLGVLDAELEWEPGAAPSGAVTQGAACTPDLGPPIDLELFGLDFLSQEARESGGRVSMAPRAFVRNLGPGDVAWGYAIAPDSPLGPHPYLALAFYRLSADGVLEQIGRADAKHAFYSINENCDCAGGNVMFATCEDVYGIFTNLDRRYLAPRDEIDAATRSWTSLGSHFDGAPVDDVRDHGAAGHDDFEHRLTVLEPDLQSPGARYFYEAWYLAAGDTQLANSLGHREVAPSLQAQTWSFPEIDAGLVNGSIVDEWVAPGSPPPGADNRWLDTGEGRLQLAVVSEDLGGGLYGYAWTLMNFDFERQVRSFTVPLAGGQSVSATGFSDSDADPGNDWSAAVGPGGLTWTAPAGNALDWGGLYSFRAEIDAAPVATHARLGPLEPGAPAALHVATLGPASPAVPALGAGALALAAAALGLAAWLWSRRVTRSVSTPPHPED